MFSAKRSIFSLSLAEELDINYNTACLSQCKCKIITNFKNKMQGIYHGIVKRMMPLYLNKYEWHFNHRHTKDLMNKICQYMRIASIMTRKIIHSITRFFYCSQKSCFFLELSDGKSQIFLKSKFFCIKFKNNSCILVFSMLYLLSKRGCDEIGRRTRLRI